LYSILWNLVCGLILGRVWFLRASPALILGLYLILNGLGRFVEESYRGEPQTPMVGRLRLYQVMAILSVVTGAAVTTINTASVTPDPELSWISVFTAAGVGLAAWFALGVDFPHSNRRFARLA
jgi:prolipoprotein diacylglyceryltransferase